ncbi:MAG: hypothetical protein PHC39_04530 [Proteiniphilum sp.]|nr:hypothetical protein [Proteiniphilum sp.]
MTFKDYFEMGRENERHYQEKKRMRVIARVVKKPSPFSIAGIIMGLGTLYEIIYPLISKFKRKKPETDSQYSYSVISVIKYDIKRLWERIKKDRKWEEYQRFEELAKGGK